MPHIDEDVPGAAVAHSHPESDVTGLSGDLAGKAATAHTHTHGSTTGQGANDHHAKSHGHTGADASGTVAHSDTTGKTANDHHNQAHTEADHSDAATARRQPLDHDHVGSGGTHGGNVAHSATTGKTANDHHNQAHTEADHSDAATATRIPALHARRGAKHSDAFLPTKYIAQSVDRLAMANLSWLTSGRETLTGIVLPAGPVNFASVFSQTTALVTGTHQWFSLRDKNRNLLAVTADDLANAWAASTEKSLYFSQVVTDAAITSGSNVLTSAAAAAGLLVVGQQVIVAGAGAAGAPLGGGVTNPASAVTPVTIASVGLDGANTCRLSSNAGTTIASGGTAYIAKAYTVASEDFYYIGTMVAAGTVPSTAAAQSLAVIVGLAPILCGRDDTNTGLTTPALAPSQSAVPATIFGGQPYIGVG